MPPAATPGAYKAGRFWRIPRRALRAGGVAEAGLRDELATELRAATEACRQLAAELNDLHGRALGDAAGEPVAPASRDWSEIARELAELEEMIAGLPARADRAPQALAVAEARAAATRARRSA